MKLEHTILSNLINNEEFTRKTLMFLDTDYFQDVGDKVVFKLISKFVGKYNSLPTIEVLKIETDNAPLSEGIHERSLKTIEILEENLDAPQDLNWLLDTTEKFCQDKAIHNALKKSIEIMDDSDDKNIQDRGSIPGILQDALAVSFDSSIGHDVIEDMESRYAFYTNVEERIPFDLDYMNDITKGGLPKKTLNVILAGCVHPSTNIDIKIGDDEQKIQILKVKQLLEDGEVVHVSSPDGWVEITQFVDKGMWDEYVVVTESGTVRCNQDHLFKTTLGWMSAKEMRDLYEYSSRSPHIYHESGKYLSTSVMKTGGKIPIVDIQIGHPNRRYYAEGLESHNTGVGKSLFMCHMATANLLAQQNVLYITLEMAEERIAERIDANLLDTNINELSKLTFDEFKKKHDRVKQNSLGRLIIKEYPTSSAHVGHFRHLLNELKQKRNFVPDIIYIDYLNICASAKVKAGSANSYTIVKSIAEEIRGLAMEFNLPIVTATQTNRTGYGDTDVEMSDVSESFGLPQTADFFFAVISSDELQSLNQIMVKQLKNRYTDLNMKKRFVVGIDKPLMRLYNVDADGQGLNEDVSIVAQRENSEFRNKMNGFK